MLRKGTAREIALEAELLAEEKRIIDIIKACREHKRNLALERIYLEKLHAKLIARKKARAEKIARKKGVVIASSDEPDASTSSQPEVSEAGLEEENCFVGVDLTLTKSVFFPLKTKKEKKDKSEEKDTSSGKKKKQKE